MIIVNVVSIFTDMGYRLLIVRELAVKPKLLTPEYIFPKLILKLCILLAVGTAVLVYSFYNDHWGFSLALTISLIISGWFLSLSNTIFSIFQSFNKYNLESLSLLFMVICLSFVLVLSRRDGGIPIFLYGYMVTTMLTFWFSFRLLSKHIIKFSFYSFPKLNLKEIKSEFLTILPFGSIMLIEALNNSFDTFFVEHYCSNVDLGEYSALIKIVTGLTIFAFVITNATMPVISRITKDGKIQSFRILFLIISGIMLCAFGVFVIYFFFNELLINFLLGKNYLFLTEWDTFIFVLTITAYIRILPGMFFVTSNRENIRLYIALLTFLTTIGYFYFTIPGNGSEVAANSLTYVKIITTSLMVLCFLYILIKERLKLTKTS